MKIKRILAYGLPVLKNMAVMRTCMELKVEFCQIKNEDLHKTIGFLCGVQGIGENAAEYDISSIDSKMGEIILFAGFNSDELDVFLEKYKELGVESVKSKAILTEYNALWSLAFLYKEIERERKEIESKGVKNGN